MQWLSLTVIVDSKLVHIVTGGEPNICGGGREGVPCGECPADTYWAGSKCTGCSAWSVIAWIMCVILIFVGAAV